MCVLFAHVIADAKENYCQIEALEDISRIKFLLLQTVKKKKKNPSQKDIILHLHLSHQKNMRKLFSS